MQTCFDMIGINITHFVCVALVIQHAKRLLYINDLWPVRLYQIFISFLIKGTIFGGGGGNGHKNVFRFSLQLLSVNFSF
jgi:cell shape-determining protein MreD